MRKLGKKGVIAISCTAIEPSGYAPNPKPAGDTKKKKKGATGEGEKGPITGTKHNKRQLDTL